MSRGPRRIGGLIRGVPSASPATRARTLAVGTGPRRGVLLLVWLGLLAGGCVEPIPAVEPPEAAGFPECQADEYLFAGHGTLRGLGLHTATPVPPPDIDRVAMIWVTADFKTWDPGPEGGPLEMTRMLCFQFADGNGGAEWPVDAAWQPPADGAVAPADESDGGPLPPMLGVALVVLLSIGASLVAFRSRR